MSTENICISAAWTNVASITDLSVLLTWTVPVSIELVTSLEAVAPTVRGHIFPRETPVNRSMIGTGYVWARTPPNSYPNQIVLTVSKYHTPPSEIVPPADGDQVKLVDRELLSTCYVVKQAWTGVSIGDVVRKTVAFDVAGATMVVLSILWENESTGFTVIAPPSIAAYLSTVKQGDALTLTQLLSAGMATTANQVTQIGYLADLADANDPFAALKLSNSEEIGDTAYVLKTFGSRWVMTKIVSTTTTDVVTYAGVGNNNNTTSTTAWSNRATLVYGPVGSI